MFQLSELAKVIHPTLEGLADPEGHSSTQFLKQLLDETKHLSQNVLKTKAM